MAYCPECGAKNEEGAKFCGSCGKTLNDLPAALLPSRKSFPFTVIITLVVVAVLAIAALVIWQGREGGSDEQQIERLMYRQAECMNNGDWKTLYEMCSPGYRQACSFEEFANYNNEMLGLTRLFLHNGKIEISNVDVTFKGDNVAYATYTVKVGGDVAWSDGRGVFIKRNGRWYITEDNSSAPGYNEEDMAIIRSASEGE